LQSRLEKQAFQVIGVLPLSLASKAKEIWLQSRLEKQAFQVVDKCISSLYNFYSEKNELQSRLEKQAFQVVIVSAFIPHEGIYEIKRISVAIPPRKAGISSF